MNDDIHAMAPLYVLGALDADEVREFEAHLSGCADCQREVAEMREVTADLSEMVAAEPPSELRAAVLAQVAETPQESVAPTRGRHAGPVLHVEPAATEPPPANVVPMRRSWVTKASAAVAAVAVAAAAVFGGWALNERDDAQQEAQVANERADELIQVLSAPDLETGTADVSGGGTATVLRSESEDAALLVASGLPSLPSGKVYEAWAIDADQNPVPAGTFASEGDDTTFTLTPAAVAAGAVALTVEPEGGSDQPTTEPIVAIDMTTA